MRLHPAKRTLALLAFGILSCTDAPTAPVTAWSPTAAINASAGVAAPELVISQVYGGGGNSGATLRNDFIELFNPGAVAVDVTGWSVQYASSGGSSWQVTALSGSIPAGGYYLVQQAAGTGGTVSLPAPDATGSIPMSGSAGKVAISRTIAALSGTCPTGVVDVVSFGTSATNCGAGTTPTLSSTTAAIRNDDGCAYTGSLISDFTTGAPAPRNSASAANVCGGAPVDAVVASIEVTPASASIEAGATQALAAAARNAAGDQVSTDFTWSTSDAAVATVADGVVSAVAAGTATITATAPNGVAGSAAITVTPAPPPPSGEADVVISQVYGGGGNSGAPLRNDYVELFNRGSDAVNLAGWRVHYASSSGSTYSSATIESGTVQPGGYFLVQLASNNTSVGASLPTPDASGGLNLSGSSGKILLTGPGVAVAEPCPTGAEIVDRVGYGANPTATGCESQWGGRAGGLSNSTAAFRADDGCTDTGSGAADFLVSAAAPRNSATATKTCVAPPPPPPSSDIVITEIMASPNRAAGGASYGEWFELHNRGTSAIDLQGWTISSGGQADHVIGTSLLVAPGAYVVLGRGADVTKNGGITIQYNYFTGSTTTIWLDNTDVLSLKDAGGAVHAEARWMSAGTMALGMSRALRSVGTSDANVDGAGWGYSTTTFGDGDFGTPGAANGTLSSTPPAIPNWLSFSGREIGDPAIPVGFEDQIFATLNSATGPVSTTISWSSETPSIATIDSRGLVRAVSAGTATFRATASDGTTGTYSLPMTAGVASSTAQYGHNVEFGLPADADASDEIVLTRAQYTSSFSPARNIPNWVSYNVDATHFGAEDRCDCFTYDAELPQARRYTTADYTGAGTFHGYGIDRGHLARSADRTAASLDNAATYYFSNIIPQAADNNQGPWASLETFLGNEAKTGSREVYIIAGASGSKGTLKNEGLVTIPSLTWKVAVLMPRDRGLANVATYEDVEVIAVIMPNDAGIRNTPWQTFTTTVDAVEALSGYDLLALLPDHIEAAVESNTKPPIGALDGPYAGAEGSPVTMSAVASRDPNGTIASYAWSFGDGTTASGATVSHSYANNGSYTVTLTLTDNDGLTAVVTTTAQVSNVAPAIATFGGASLLAGEGFSRSGTFADPGADAWTATVDYGDGAGPQPLALSGQSFLLSHVYTAPGTYAVTVTLSDGEATSQQAATVVVVSAADGARRIAALVDAYAVSGELSSGTAQSLRAKALGAAASLESGNAQAARGQLGAFLNELSALERSGRLDAAAATALRAAAQRVLAVT